MTVPVNFSSTSMPGAASALRGRDPRSGIALVIVLGMMALLMVLAVGFFVAMRTERLAARSFADEVRARQMAHAAITRAVADVDAEIAGANRVIPNWPNEARASLGGTAVSPAFLTTADMTYSNIPTSLMSGALNTAGSVTWITAPYGNGRFAYMVVNVSGLLDPNRDYSTTNSVVFPRDVGYDVNEIAFENAQIQSILPELTAGAATSSRMVKGRTSTTFRTKPYLRAETIPDLWIVGRYQYGGATPLTSYPQNFFPYSYFPLGYRDAAGVATNAVYIGGTAAAADAQRAVIQGHFLGMGLAATDAASAASNLIDYLDEDLVPGGINGGGVTTGANCDSFATEPVPMINQFMIRTAFGTPVLGVRPLTVEVTAQVWYPFVNTTNLPFGLKVQAEVVGEGYSAVSPTAPPPVLLGNAWSQNTFATNQVNFVVQTTSTNYVPTSLIIRELAIVDAQNRVVDRVCGPDRPVTISPWNSFFTYQNGIPRLGWWWVGDPRINWLWDPVTGINTQGTGQWRMGGRLATTGGPANWMARHPSVLGEYGRFEMYVRNRGDLRTVGELGMMVARESWGAERSPVQWRTIELLSTNALPVLDRFTVQTRTQQGLVNPNTLNHRPVAAVLVDTPLERWPGEAGAPRLTAAQALQAATEIRTAYAASHFLNRSDMSRTTFTVGADDAQREGLMRNAAQLFSTRQNLFLVIVRGQALSPSGGIVMGEAQAVALVWRDPYLVNGRNQTRIRWIRWMEQ